MPSEQFAVRLEVSRGPLVLPLVARIVGMAASRAGFELTVLDSTVDVAETLASRAAAESDALQLGIAVATLPDGVQLVIGGLRSGGAERLIAAAGSAPGATHRSAAWSIQAGIDGDEVLICTIDAPPRSAGPAPACFNAATRGNTSF